MNDCVTLRKINERNQAFWSARTANIRETLQKRPIATRMRRRIEKTLAYVAGTPDAIERLQRLRAMPTFEEEVEHCHRELKESNRKASQVKWGWIDAKGSTITRLVVEFASRPENGGCTRKILFKRFGKELLLKGMEPVVKSTCKGGRRYEYQDHDGRKRSISERYFENILSLHGQKAAH